MPKFQVSTGDMVDNNMNVMQQVLDQLNVDGIPARLESMDGVDRILINVDDSHLSFGTNLLVDSWDVTLVDDTGEEERPVNMKLADTSVDVAAIVAAIKATTAVYESVLLPDPIPVTVFDEGRMRTYIKGYGFLTSELDRLGSLRAVYDTHIVTDAWRSNEYNKI